MNTLGQHNIVPGYISHVVSWRWRKESCQEKIRPCTLLHVESLTFISEDILDIYNRRWTVQSIPTVRVQVDHGYRGQYNILADLVPVETFLEIWILKISKMLNWIPVPQENGFYVQFNLHSSFQNAALWKLFYTRRPFSRFASDSKPAWSSKLHWKDLKKQSLCCRKVI